MFSDGKLANYQRSQRLCLTWRRATFGEEVLKQIYRDTKLLTICLFFTSFSCLLSFFVFSFPFLQCNAWLALLWKFTITFIVGILYVFFYFLDLWLLSLPILVSPVFYHSMTSLCIYCGLYCRLYVWCLIFATVASNIH